MLATNNVRKPTLPLGIDNVIADTGGLASAAGATSVTWIALTTLTDVADGATLTVVGAESNNETLELRSLNTYDIRESLVFKTWGAISGAAANGNISTTSALSKVHVGGATLNTPGALAVSARSSGSVRLTIAAETFGAATVSVGTADVAGSRR